MPFQIISGSATTYDWLEAMKNQSGSMPGPSHITGDVGSVLTREQFESALRQASRPVASRSGSKTK